MKKLYGLFGYTYDYYEWELLICASEHPYKLKEQHEAMNTRYKIFSKVEHDKANEDHNEICHFLIKEIKLI